MFPPRPGLRRSGGRIPPCPPKRNARLVRALFCCDIFRRMVYSVRSIGNRRRKDDKALWEKQRFADGRRNNNKDGLCGYGAVLRVWAVRTSGRKSRLRKAAAEEADRLIPDHRRFPVVISAARPVPMKRRAKKALLSDRQKSFSVACFDASRYNCLRNTD